MVFSCRRSDVRTAVIRVPEMKDEAAARIVRNALESEFDRSDGSTSVKMAEREIIVTRWARGLSSARGIESKKSQLGTRIADELKAVGLPGQIKVVYHVLWCPTCGSSRRLEGPYGGAFYCPCEKEDPQCPRRAGDVGERCECAKPRGCPRRLTAGEVAASTNMWANTFSVRITVPGMQTKRDANAAVAAAWHALRGLDDGDIVLDRTARVATVYYESLSFSIKNLEVAIAGAGLQANDVPANLGAIDALPGGW
jgi:hypothetical protein